MAQTSQGLNTCLKILDGARCLPAGCSGLSTAGRVISGRVQMPSDKLPSSVVCSTPYLTCGIKHKAYRVPCKSADVLTQQHLLLSTQQVRLCIKDHSEGSAASDKRAMAERLARQAKIAIVDTHMRPSFISDSATELLTCVLMCFSQGGGSLLSCLPQC